MLNTLHDSHTMLHRCRNPLTYECFKLEVAIHSIFYFEWKVEIHDASKRNRRNCRKSVRRNSLSESETKICIFCFLNAPYKISLFLYILHCYVL